MPVKLLDFCDTLHSAWLWATACSGFDVLHSNPVSCVSFYVWQYVPKVSAWPRASVLQCFKGHLQSEPSSGLRQSLDPASPRSLRLLLLPSRPDRLPRSRLVSALASPRTERTPHESCSAAPREMAYSNHNLTIHLAFCQDMETRRSCFTNPELLEKLESRVSYRKLHDDAQSCEQKKNKKTIQWKQKEFDCDCTHSSSCFRGWALSVFAWCKQNISGIYVFKETIRKKCASITD